MEDSYIIANFHTLCRLCLTQSSLSVSIFGVVPDDESNLAITSKIADCFELQIDPNDGLPGRICYKCLFKIDKCSKFKIQCIQSETRLRQITNGINEFENSNSSELSNYSNQKDIKPKTENFVVEDSVVMVVDPSLDYDSTEESENTEQNVEQEPTKRDHTPEVEPIHEKFLKNVAMCQYCDQAFISQEKCKEHELTHDPNLPYSCIECSLVFSERSQSIQHTKQVHGNDKPYHCPECDKCFGRRSDLRKHSIVHTGIRPYQCHYCLKNFSRNTNLSKHLLIHTSEKPHVCPLCPRSFVAKVDLDRHVLVHSGMKPYACRRCPMTFDRRDKLLKHEARHGPISPEQKPDINHPESHDMVVNVNPFNNIVTSSQFTTEGQTEYDLPHVPDHITGEGSFISQQVPKSTTMKPNQTSPSKPKPISNKNKPKNIKCHQCSKRFSSLDAYKTHVSIAHIGSRGFQCKICFKKFARKRELDRHATLHTGMKPFSCNQCDKKFTRRDKLVKHEQTHDTLVVNMPCIECGATFEQKAELVAHIKSHFSEELDEKSSEIEPKQEFPMDDSFYDIET